MLDPIHPGEILEEEFMKPLELSANALARALDVPVTRVSEIVRGRRGMTADTALRLARLFGTTPEFWLGLQSDFDLRVARRDSGRAIGEAVSPLRGKRVLDRLEVRETGTRYGPTSAHTGSTAGAAERPSAPWRIESTSKRRRRLSRRRAAFRGRRSRPTWALILRLGLRGSSQAIRGTRASEAASPASLTDRRPTGRSFGESSPVWLREA